MDWTWYLFRFDGRINRAKLWLAGVVELGLMMSVGLVIVAIHACSAAPHPSISGPRTSSSWSTPTRIDP
jgi:uncharacterized membrane protein YhaH (DUF805 family)